jgi:hypothetical protein
MENQSFLGPNLVYSFELNEIPQPHLADCVGANWFSVSSEQNEKNFRGLVLHKINPEKVILLKELTNTKEKLESEHDLQQNSQQDRKNT